MREEVALVGSSIYDDLLRGKRSVRVIRIYIFKKKEKKIVYMWRISWRGHHNEWASRVGSSLRNAPTTR